MIYLTKQKTAYVMTKGATILWSRKEAASMVAMIILLNMYKPPRTLKNHLTIP